MPHESNDWESCLTNARQAEEDYDYENAVALYRRAVELNDGVATLLELTRFLFEIYAAYDDLVVCLEGRQKALRGSDVLRLRFARALYLSGAPEGAEKQYAELAEATLEADDWFYLGQIRQERGDLRGALECFSRAQRSNPANPAYQRAADEALAHLNDEASSYVGRAEALVESDPTEARAIIAAMHEQGLRHPRATEIIEQLEARDRADALALAMDAARAEREPQRRQRAYGKVLQLDPENDEARRELAALEAELGATRAQTAFEAGLELVVGGDVNGAIDAYLRALAVPNHAEFLRDWDPDVDPLWRLASAAYRHFGALDVERVKESLGRLFRIAEHVEFGREASAADLERIGKQMRGFAPYEALSASLARVERERRQQEAAGALDDARRASGEGDYDQALEKLELAVKRWGGDFSESAELRELWRQEKARSERRSTALQLIRDRIAEEQWFRARRLLATQAAEFAEEAAFVALHERVRGAIDERFALRALPVGANQGTGAIDLARLELEPGWVQLATSRGRLFVARGDRIVRAALPSLRVEAHFVLPESAGPIGMATPIAVFDEPQATLVARLDPKARAVDVIRLRDESADWVDRIDLSAELSAGRAYLFCAPAFGETALTLLSTSTERRRPSRLLSVGLLDGRVQALEDYSYGLYHLTPIANEARYLVSRFFDLQRGLTPGFFSLATLDSRGRLGEKYFYEDVYDDLATVEWAARDPESGWLHLNYRSANPLTGEVLPEAYGYMVIREDRSLFYQSSKPEHLVGTKRRITAPFALDTSGARLLVGYREEGLGGVQLLRPADFSKAEDLSLGEGWIPRSIVVSAADGCAIVVAANESDETSIRTIDLTARRWLEA
ncbi:MAG: hypothetical protein KC609_24380 [Myxococcales bacterium]|nr:hypothetical protein [Myxococcales bacterium]